MTEGAHTGARSGIILLGDRRLAAIERIRDGARYHVLPGGTCEAGEEPAAAAVREAYEELGLAVGLDGLVATVHFRGRPQYYYAAHMVSGTFGTGTGAELSGPAPSPAGSYRPVWLRLNELPGADLRPRPLARLLHAAGDASRLLGSWLAQPIEIHERPDSATRGSGPPLKSP